MKHLHLTFRRSRPLLILPQMKYTTADHYERLIVEYTTLQVTRLPSMFGIAL